jgi:hypothetical protein
MRFCNLLERTLVLAKSHFFGYCQVCLQVEDDEYPPVKKVFAMWQWMSNLLASKKDLGRLPTAEEVPMRRVQWKYFIKVSDAQTEHHFSQGVFVVLVRTRQSNPRPGVRAHCTAFTSLRPISCCADLGVLNDDGSPAHPRACVCVCARVCVRACVRVCARARV